VVLAIENMKCLLMTILPALCSAQSHVQVSLGGTTYAHGAKVELPAASPVYSSAPAPATYHTPAPVYHTPAPVYHTPAPVYHTPAPVYHRPATYHAAPVYHTPKQNCSVVDEVAKVKVCTPAFETKCSSVDLTVKTIVDKEQCQDITRTVCTVSDEVVENNICVYSYEKQSESTLATTVKVTYAKECSKQYVTVCQPGRGYGGYQQSYGQQYCKQQPQNTCYNVPKVTKAEKKVSVVFPSPVKSCTNKPISVPRVSCEDLIENKCITVPDVKDEVKSVEKCEVALAEPSCQYVSLTLPKQVCTELVYGHAKAITAQQYHAKVL